MNSPKKFSRREFVRNSSTAVSTIIVGGRIIGSSISETPPNAVKLAPPATVTTTSASIVLDNPRTAKLATEDSVLAHPIDASQTTFDVVTSSGAVWTTDMNEFSAIAGG